MTYDDEKKTRLRKKREEEGEKREKEKGRREEDKKGRREEGKKGRRQGVKKTRRQEERKIRIEEMKKSKRACAPGGIAAAPTESRSYESGNSPPVHWWGDGRGKKMSDAAARSSHR